MNDLPIVSIATHRIKNDPLPVMRDLESPMSFCKVRGSVRLLPILIQEPGVITAECSDLPQEIVFMGLGVWLVMAVEVAAETPGTRVRPNTIALWRWPTSGLIDWES